MNFLPDDKLLPCDWVEEAKILLFIKMEVTNGLPKKRKRLNEAKRKRQEEEKAHEKKKKKQLGGAVMVERNEEHVGLLDESIIFEVDDDNVQTPIVMMYNSVRGYVSSIYGFWSHQISHGIHQAPQPHRVVIKALETSIVHGEYICRRKEYTDRGIGTMRDGYLQRQIPDFTHQVWFLAFGEKAIEQSFWTLVDFLFGNTMLLRLSNRLPMEVPDLFLMPLPKEGGGSNRWCLVCVMDQGKYIIFFALLFLFIIFEGKPTSTVEWNMVVLYAIETIDHALLVH